MKKKFKILIFFMILVTVGFFVFSSRGKASNDEVVNVSQIPVRPQKGDIQVTISTTGTIQPQNRLEVQPPISGRIEEVLVKEGDQVTAGDIIVWMSSTDRAALLDTARAKGAEELAYWQDVYKAAPLVAPMDGTVIVRSVEPGQTVTTSDAVIVLSDRLVVEAEVDETDIGGVKVGQRTMISLDAYPDIQVGGYVDHISYESIVTNNVTIYEVDIVPDEVPEVFRSGMSANLEIVTKETKNAIMVPLDAVQSDARGKYVMVFEHGESLMRPVQIGLSNDDYIEIISGLSLDDQILTDVQAFNLPKPGGNDRGSNPFMPKFPDRKKKN